MHDAFVRPTLLHLVPVRLEDPSMQALTPGETKVSFRTSR